MTRFLKVKSDEIDAIEARNNASRPDDARKARIERTMAHPTNDVSTEDIDWYHRHYQYPSGKPWPPQ